MVKENELYYIHTYKGGDDMPAHAKNVIIDSSVTKHKLNLGTWQELYLCEFRKQGGARKIVATIVY